MRQYRRSKLSRGFSLIELLVVLGLVGALGMLSIWGFNQVLKGSRLTTASRLLWDELNLARQIALSRNAAVEVRFYQLPEADQAVDSPPVSYRALQTFVWEDNTPSAVGKVSYLPQQVVLITDPAKSSLFLASGGPLQKAGPQPADRPMEPYGSNYSYISFRFKPNGETDMNDVPAFVTMAMQNEKKTSSGLPVNFVTIQIDPVNGRLREFRP